MSIQMRRGRRLLRELVAGAAVRGAGHFCHRVDCCLGCDRVACILHRQQRPGYKYWLLLICCCYSVLSLLNGDGVGPKARPVPPW